MKIQNVFVPRDGLVFDVSHKIVTLDVIFMANAKMGPVYVFLGGMESTVLWKAVLTNVDPLQNLEQVDMGNVNEPLVLVLILMVIGGRVSVMRGGKEMIAASSWKLIVMMDMITIKVRRIFNFLIADIQLVDGFQT